MLLIGDPPCSSEAFFSKGSDHPILLAPTVILVLLFYPFIQAGGAVPPFPSRRVHMNEGVLPPKPLCHKACRSMREFFDTKDARFFPLPLCLIRERRRTLTYPPPFFRATIATDVAVPFLTSDPARLQSPRISPAIS